MLEHELKELFTESEFEAFKNFLRGHTVGIRDEEAYFYIYDIQIFVHWYFNGTGRLDEIMKIAVEKYPQLIGYKRENI